MKYTKHKVTMAEIAKILGVSKNSVSLALNGKSGVSDELREKIVTLSRELNYRNYTAGQESKSKCIIVVAREYLRNDAFFYADVFWSIEKEAKDIGYISINTIISHESEINLTLPLLPKDLDVCGFLIIGIISNAYIRKLLEVGLPIISVDILYHDLPMGCIASSNLSGGYTATKYLIEKGHRNIGFIGPIYSAQSVYERWCGFNQALNHYSLSSNNSYNIVGQSDRFELFDTVEALQIYLNKIDIYPTAWFCAGDRIAIALINLLSRKGVKIPDEVSVMGFDDIPVAQMIFPLLTTMRVERSLMGKLAVDYLANYKAQHMEQMNISLSCTLVERDSIRTIN